MEADFDKRWTRDDCPCGRFGMFLATCVSIRRLLPQPFDDKKDEKGHISFDQGPAMDDKAVHCL